MGLSGRKKPQLNSIDRKIAREDFEVYFDDARARLGHAVTLAQGAIRSLVLVSGGAILSLLTLVGNSSVEVEKVALYWAFFWFGGALVTGLLSSILAAVSQINYMMSSTEEGWKAQAESYGKAYPNDGTNDDRLGDRATLFALSSAIFSLILFIVGSFVALGAIT